MVILSPQLAQAIVERTMGILPHTIIVMDERGVIIGTEDAARRGKYHEGARLAIQQQRIVEVDSVAASRLIDVRPGVNLPLRLEGRVVGVVGITGDPHEVRQFAELVRMTAEMMLEQRQLLAHIERDARLGEELVLQLIQREEPPDVVLQQWATRLGIDLATPRIAIVIHVDGQVLDEERGLEDLQQLQTRLGQAGRESLLARRSLREFVLLYPALTRLGRWDAGILQQELQPLFASLQEGCIVELHAAIGHYFGQPGEIALSYQTARATLQQPQKQRPLLQAFEEQRLPVLLSPLAQGWQSELLRLPLSRVMRQDRDATLYTTLACWFDHDLNYTRTASALNIHRNTLDYRLQRVAEITHLQLDRLEERVQLYIALQLHRFQQANQ